MSQTPLKGFKKFNTITITDKVSKNLGSAGTFRLTDRKTNSVLTNPESIMNTTLPAVDQNLSLPKINGKKRHKKQGSFLQSWLDEALGSPDPFMKQQQKKTHTDDFSVLKTIRKYQLDKRFLQSQNIPTQKIQKMYQSLYIYSHGVDKVFEQLLQFAQQKDNNDLLNNFWRAYSKLLQGSTSYQTVFQKVERQHLQNIRGLKNSIETRTQMFAQQRKQLQLKIKQYEKINEQKQNKLQHLKIQYDVLQSTLQLTDQAFNEQVNLRLKFQQKINAIYTTYSELKGKYTKIVQEMSIKNLDIIDRQNIENQLKNKLLVERTKVDELMFLLKAQKDKTLQRQTELTIKKQQLQDAKSMLIAKQNQQDKKHDQMQQFLMQLKSMKTKQIEANNKRQGQKITIRQQEEHIDKLTKSLQEYKLHNGQLYEKYANAGKNVVALESKIENMNIIIADLQNDVQNKASEVTNLNRQLAHVKAQRDNLRNQLDVSNKNLRDTRDTMTKNNLILEDMKAVKDKYQRINQILRDQVKQLETAHNKSSKELSLKTQQFQGMKMLIEGRDKAIIEMQKAMQNQKQLNKIKIDALNGVITKKQNLLLQNQKKKQQTQKQLAIQKQKLAAAQDKIIIMESNRMKLEVQLSGKVKILSDLQNILDSENKKYKQINQKLEGQLKHNSQINSKLMATEFVLKTKNQEQRVQIVSLSTLLNQYKSKIISRAQHVHPMVYEEALQIARRSSQNQIAAKVKLQANQKDMVIYRQTNKKLQVLAGQQKTKIQQLQQKINKISQQNTKLIEKLKKIQQSLKSNINLYQKQQQKAQKYSQQIQKYKINQINGKQKIVQLQNISSNLRIKIQELMNENGKFKSRQNKRQTKKSAISKQVQTQNIQHNIQYKQTNDQQIQTQMQNQQQQFRNTTSQMMKPVYQQHKQAQLQTKKQTKQLKEPVPQKKVETKDFKKALKLTYMRR